MTHSLYSQDQERTIAFFEKFNKEDIKEQIISHLKEFPSDTLEHCKEYSKSDIKRFYGNEILSFYEVNPKNGKVSKVVQRGGKNYFKQID